MAGTQTKDATQQDAEKAQDKKRRLEPAPVPMKALADEPIPFPGLLGVSAMELPLEKHAAFLGDPRLSHSANSAQKIRMVTDLQQNYGNAYVQRVVGCIQAKKDKSPPEEERSLTDIGQRIAAQKGSGQPLEPGTHTEMEASFGKDFSDVHIHTDTEANRLSRELGAKAFTTGKDIFFREGAYQPTSEAGKGLLAHELTHVVQQAKVKPEISQPKTNVSEMTQYIDEEADQPEAPASIRNTEILSGMLSRMTSSKTRLDILMRAPAKKTKEGVEALAKKFERLKKREDCWGCLSLTRDKLEKKKGAWERAARDLGGAYEGAYNSHKKTVDAQAKLDAIQADLAFGVLAAIAGGSLAFIGPALKAGKLGFELREVVASGVEDVIQSTVGASVVAIGKLAVAPSAETVSTSPLGFQRSLEGIIGDQWDKVLDFFIKVKTELFEADLATFDSMDPKKIKERLDKELAENRFMKEPKKQDFGKMKDELERGMWAKWVPSLKVIIPSRPKTMGAEYYEKPGTIVEDRLNELGITARAGIGKTFGWWTSSVELDKLAAWARSFSPKKFEF